MTAVEGINPAGSQLPAPVQKPHHPKMATTPETEKSSFSFGDFIDVINPLQHIPGVAELYRSITNDQISDGARRTGNMIYGFALGGPLGLGAMMAYNNVGGRAEETTMDVAKQEGAPKLEAAQAEAVVSADAATDTPVPAVKPASDKDAEEAGAKASGPQILGQSIAAAGEAVGSPLDLTTLITGVSAEQRPVEPDIGSKAVASEGAASSVAFGLEPDGEAEEKPFLPNTQSLDRIASHEANRLPLDVLKALQERHAQRTASERS